MHRGDVFSEVEGARENKKLCSTPPEKLMVVRAREKGGLPDFS